MKIVDLTVILSNLPILAIFMLLKKLKDSFKILGFFQIEKNSKNDVHHWIKYASLTDWSSMHGFE